MALKVGDWVTTCWAGIWRIYRILNYKCSDPLAGEERFHTTVFSKRFLSKTFKQLFGQACCDPSFISNLGPEDQKRLEAFIADNPTVYAKFESYQPKPVDCIYNARIGIPTDRSAKEVAALFDKKRLIHESDIDPMLKDMGFDTNALPAWTVQFVSKDHEGVDDYLVYRFDRVLKF
jgi:hypothetical protein